MTRLYIPAMPIEVVTMQSITPQRFVWARRQHPIARVEDYWIIDLSWWRPDDYIARDCFLVTTQTGLLAEIFRSRLTENWYLQRLHD